MSQTSKRRPNQQTVDTRDLTDSERDILAKLIENEVIRLDRQKKI